MSYLFIPNISCKHEYSNRKRRDSKPDGSRNASEGCIPSFTDQSTREEILFFFFSRTVRLEMNAFMVEEEEEEEEEESLILTFVDSRKLNM